MNLPSNLDADQARIVILTLAALTQVEKVRAADRYPGEDEERAEERSLDCIQEQIDSMDEVEFAQLIRALIDAWEARQ